MVGAFGLLTSCTDLGFEAEITNRQPFDPPAIYGTWWTATESCSRESGRLDRIEWYLATSIVSDGVLAFGAWTPPHEILIVSGYEDNEVIVRHEMLHDLLDGDSEHRSSAWAICDLIPD